MSFSWTDRNQTGERMSGQDYDLVIIGGGITGAGIARDAASRGMRVALVEAQDFAQGTSSRSSKLIHGGIRYLENLEFHLVFEALSERRLLFEIAPHLVHPLRFVLPLYKQSRVGMFKMGLGMWLYDALSTFEAPELHERLSPVETMQRLPLLQARDLVGSYVYSDAYMDDDRLVMETLRSAVRFGTDALSYVRAIGAKQDSSGKIVALECLDQTSHKRFFVRGSHFISTVGPWTDIFAHKIFHDWRHVLRPSKGVHLTFDRRRLGLQQAVVMAADNDKRIVFGIPRHEMCIVGTTDTDFSGDPAEVNTTKADVDYLLHVADQYFPGAQLTEEDIIATYAGVRPLIDDGSETESKTSREHLIYHDPRNVTFVAGGKYTTYRRMAEQTVQAVLRYFSVDAQVRFARNRTEEALNPSITAEGFAQAMGMSSVVASEYGLPEEVASLLLSRHGHEALALLKGETALDRQSKPGVRLWKMEARHALRHTMCGHLTDFVWRRSPLFLSARDHGAEFYRAISEIFAETLRWSSAQVSDELGKLQLQADHDLSWRSRLTRVAN